MNASAISSPSSSSYIPPSPRSSLAASPASTLSDSSLPVLTTSGVEKGEIVDIHQLQGMIKLNVNSSYIRF